MKLLTIILMITAMSSVCGQQLLTLQTCKSLDSVLIDCACETFLDDINEVISEIYNSSEIRSGNSQIQDILSVATLTPLMTAIFPNVLAICRKTSAFHNCLKERNFTLSNNLADVYTRYFFPEVDNIKNFTDAMCEMLDEIRPKVECVAGKVLPSARCVISSLNQLTRISYLNHSSPTFGSDLLAFLCPYIGDISNCVSIQVFPCGEKISVGITKMVQSTSPTCVAKLSEGKKSSLIYCGLEIYPEIQRFTVSQQSTSGFMSLIDTMCRIAPNYLQCVAREIPNSNNSLDVNLREMVDFSQISESIIRPFCDRKQELTNAIMCMVNMTTVEKCFHSNVTGPLATTDFSAQVFNGSYIRYQFCTPLYTAITCAVDIMNSICSSNIASLLHTLFLQLLRLDCNGSRSSVFSTNIVHDTTTSLHSATTVAATTGTDNGDDESSTDAITKASTAAVATGTDRGDDESSTDATSKASSVATSTGPQPGDDKSYTHTDDVYTTTTTNRPTPSGNDLPKSTPYLANGASSFSIQWQKMFFIMQFLFFLI